MGVGVKKRATPSTARITEAIVSRTAQISNRNTSRAARRDNAKAKGATNIFSSIFIQNIAISGDAIGSIWSIVGYTVLLCFSLFKTSSVAKTLLGAH